MSVSMWPQSVTDASASAEHLRDKADSLYNAQQYDEAKAISLKALDRLDKRKDKSPTTGDDETRGDLLNLLSMIHVRQGQFDLAATYARQCNELDLKGGDPGMISSSFNTLAGIYMSMRQPQVNAQLQESLDKLMAEKKSQQPDETVIQPTRQA